VIGGMSGFLNDHTVAALVYHYKKHVINVFIWPMANKGGGKSKVEDRCA
jgi:hypothetical protein